MYFGPITRKPFACFLFLFMNKFYLIRHGESIANTEGIYQGHTYNTHLSVLGRKQAIVLAKRFADIELSQVITSPLLRTWETSKAVADLKNMPLQKEEQILETNHGEWEGKHKDVILKRWPDLYQKWNKFPSGVQFPGGEHFLDTQKRVIKWWKDITGNNSGDIMVITHDNIIRIIIANVLNMKLNRIWKFHLQPTAVTLVEVQDETIRLAYLNDAKHLGDLQTNLAIHAL